MREQIVMDQEIVKGENGKDFGGLNEYTSYREIGASNVCMAYNFQFLYI